MNQEYRIKQRFILSSKTILEGFETINKLSKSNCLVLFEIDQNQRVLGSVTDGDFRRAILSGIKLNDTIANIMK